MTNLAAIERAYYTPAESSHFDRFIDWCEEQGLDYTEEDFDSWLEERIEAEYEDHCERMADYAREEEYEDSF